ncbi:unnamed protein product [Tilletia laevis]|uniref:Uncharacterized protein n=1 Tax=Tilletia laevis TaxID=157183 RepID=A0A9N8QFB6_9BASI|nr:unnamed protein product [Tilletia laevis]CAD6971983.1 unnamed protein product [Tilletia controversa]CAD7069351.1 unnamed protein product [Tilletia caries]
MGVVLQAGKISRNATFCTASVNFASSTAPTTRTDRAGNGSLLGLGNRGSWRVTPLHQTGEAYNRIVSMHATYARRRSRADGPRTVLASMRRHPTAERALAD